MEEHNDSDRISGVSVLAAGTSVPRPELMSSPGIASFVGGEATPVSPPPAREVRGNVKVKCREPLGGAVDVCEPAQMLRKPASFKKASTLCRRAPFGHVQSDHPRRGGSCCGRVSAVDGVDAGS